MSTRCMNSVMAVQHSIKVDIVLETSLNRFLNSGTQRGYVIFFKQVTLKCPKMQPVVLKKKNQAMTIQRKKFNYVKNSFQ